MKHVVTKFSFFVMLLVTTISVATATNWRELTPGLEYAQLRRLSGFHTGYIHAFRIDPSRFNLTLAIAEDQQNKIALVSDLVQASQALVGINGGFFSQELRPLGLRISNYQLRSPLKATSWWGVFYTANDQPTIVSQNNFKARPGIQFAIQSGPRLVVNGKVPGTLKPGVDNRSAVGITPDKKVILAVTENLPLTTSQFAKILQTYQVEGGLGCRDALNLDGGSSTQLYAKLTKFNLNVMGLSAVTDAILVIPKH